MLGFMIYLGLFSTRLYRSHDLSNEFDELI
jgi:hypothetical protein